MSTVIRSFPKEEDSPSYPKLDTREFNSRVNGLRSLWEQFFFAVVPAELGWVPHASNYCLADVVIRVDKRREYFSYFHDMGVSERKVAGIYAYWVVKLHPFWIEVPHVSELTPLDKQWIASVNESFAAFIMYSGVLLENSRLSGGGVAVTEHSKRSYHRALLYSLRYRALTIDSMMILMETMTPNDFDRIIEVK